MSDGHDFSISQSKRDTALLNSNNKCIYCGSKTNRLTLEHIIPMAVFKWAGEKPSQANDIRNLYSCCAKCNELKGDRIPSEDNILKYKIGYQKKKEIIRYKSENEKYINQYCNLKYKIWEKQGRKCSCCGNYKRIENCGLRRIDNTQPRTEDNASVVCLQCQRQYRHTRKERSLDES